MKKDFLFLSNSRINSLRTYLLVALRKRAGTGAGVPAPSFALSSTYQERLLRDSVVPRLENPSAHIYIYTIINILIYVHLCIL